MKLDGPSLCVLKRMRRNSDAEETNKNMLICEKIHQIYWIQSWSVAAGVITCLCACRCARAVLFQINGGVNLWESMIMHAALPAFNHGLLHPSASLHIHLWPPLCLQYIGGILRILFQMYVDESRTSSSWSKKATLLCKNNTMTLTAQVKGSTLKKKIILSNGTCGHSAWTSIITTIISDVPHNSPDAAACQSLRLANLYTWHLNVTVRRANAQNHSRELNSRSFCRLLTSRCLSLFHN